MAASAAGRAFWWKGRGWFLKATQILPLYCSSIALSVGTARLQNGHWKSENATMVTGAFLGPITGEAPIWMSFTTVGAGAGAAAATTCGAAAAACSRSLS